MPRLIDANKYPCNGCEKTYCYKNCSKFNEWLENTVDAVEVVHGKWCRDGDWLICLNCESEINVKNSLGIENRKNYCPNCGAKMRGSEE